MRRRAGKCHLHTVTNTSSCKCVQTAPLTMWGPRGNPFFEPRAAQCLVFMTMTLSQKAKIKLCFSYPIEGGREVYNTLSEILLCKMVKINI